jgi:ATP-binding cassette subfamily F protein 3
MLAKMQPIAALAEDPSLSFDFPTSTELKPPLITLRWLGWLRETPIREAEPADRSRRSGSRCSGRNGNG